MKEDAPLIMYESGQQGNKYLNDLRNRWKREVGLSTQQVHREVSASTITQSCATSAANLVKEYWKYAAAVIAGALNSYAYWGSSKKGGERVCSKIIESVNNTFCTHSLDNALYKNCDQVGEVTRYSAVSVNGFLGTYAVLAALLAVIVIFNKQDQVANYLRTGKDYVPRVTSKKMVRCIFNFLFAIAPALAFFKLTEMGEDFTFGVFVLSILVGIISYFINLLGVNGTWTTVGIIKEKLTPKSEEDQVIENIRTALDNEIAYAQQRLFQANFEPEDLRNIFGLEEDKRKRLILFFVHQSPLPSPTNLQLFRRGAWKVFSVVFATLCAIADAGYIKLAVGAITLEGLLGNLLRAAMTLCGIASFSGLTLVSVSSTLLSDETFLAKYCRPYLYRSAVAVILIDSMLSGASQTLVNYLLHWPGAWGILITLLGWPSAAIPNFFYAKELTATIISSDYFIPENKKAQAITFNVLEEIRTLLKTMPRKTLKETLQALGECEVSEVIQHALCVQNISTSQAQYIFPNMSAAQYEQVNQPMQRLNNTA